LSVLFNFCFDFNYFVCARLVYFKKVSTRINCLLIINRFILFSLRINYFFDV
jgi:hypothetical protein